MLFLWDEPKRLRNLQIHGFDFSDVEHGFDFGTALVSPSYQGRLVALGRLNDHIVALVFLPLGTEAISVISLRPASRKEREAYAQR